MAKKAKTKSAKAKSASPRKRPKAATRSTALKKTASRKKAAATSTARKTVKSKAARVSKARRALPAKPRRPKQRTAVSHHREEDFAAGFRAYAHYRDLGIADATHGLARAHVIRLIGPCDPQEVSKLHLHDVEFQMVYVLKGWAKVYLEGEGEIMMREGSNWTQPPRIRHLILDYSDNCELLEVILPAEFKTVELTA